jgi:hypothetical protein
VAPRLAEFLSRHARLTKMVEAVLDELPAALMRGFEGIEVGLQWCARPDTSAGAFSAASLTEAFMAASLALS